MREGARTCAEFVDGNSAVRFVTFNFDTFIEERLRKEVSAIFSDAPPADLTRAEEQFQPIHVHGELPLLPSLPLTYDSVRGFSQEWVKWTTEASKEIRVVHDEIDPHKIAGATAATKNAAVLCLLGFAYGVENVKRLGLRENSPAGGGNGAFGSAFELRAGEQELVRHRVKIPQLQLGKIDEKCLDVLRNYHVFRD